MKKSAEIEQEIEEERIKDYTEDNMLIKYNPYGTNTQSLYVSLQLRKRHLFLTRS